MPRERTPFSKAMQCGEEVGGGDKRDCGRSTSHFGDKVDTAFGGGSVFCWGVLVNRGDGVTGDIICRRLVVTKDPSSHYLESHLS